MSEKPLEILLVVIVYRSHPCVDLIQVQFSLYHVSPKFNTEAFLFIKPYNLDFTFRKYLWKATCDLLLPTDIQNANNLLPQVALSMGTTNVGPKFLIINEEDIRWLTSIQDGFLNYQEKCSCPGDADNAKMYSVHCFRIWYTWMTPYWTKTTRMHMS